MNDVVIPCRPFIDDPAPWLTEVLRLRGMYQINPALEIEVAGFVRYRGDWLGVVITPEAVALWLLPGGGELWGEIPAGQRRYVDLPNGTTAFLAVDDPVLGACQQSLLVEPVTDLVDMAAARLVARDMLGLLGFVPPAAAQPTSPAAPAQISRRGFFRRLAGKHQA